MEKMKGQQDESYSIHPLRDSKYPKFKTNTNHAAERMAFFNGGVPFNAE